MCVSEAQEHPGSAAAIQTQRPADALALGRNRRILNIELKSQWETSAKRPVTLVYELNIWRTCLCFLLNSDSCDFSVTFTMGGSVTTLALSGLLVVGNVHLDNRKGAIGRNWAAMRKAGDA